MLACLAPAFSQNLLLERSSASTRLLFGDRKFWSNSGKILFFPLVCLDYYPDSFCSFVEIWPSKKVVSMNKCKGKLCLPWPWSKTLAVLSHNPCPTLSSSPHGVSHQRLNFSSLTNLEPLQTVFRQLQPLSSWGPGYLSSEPLDSRGAIWVLALHPPCLVPWFLASCWQCWTFGADFGKIIDARYDVSCNYGTCILECLCHLSHGTVEPWPECGALLQYHLPVELLSVV